MIDLHTHTFLSDGLLGAAELVRRAEQAGYRAIGITDHADAANLEDLVSSAVRFARETQPYLKIRVVAGRRAHPCSPRPDRRARAPLPGSWERAW